MGGQNQHTEVPCESCLFSASEWQYLAGRLGLSQRELQILQRVFQSKSESVISGELSISPHTVHTHLGRLYSKLRVNSRVELVIYVVEKYHQFCREPGNDLGPICDQVASGGCPFHEVVATEEPSTLKMNVNCNSVRCEGSHASKT